MLVVPCSGQMSFLVAKAEVLAFLCRGMYDVETQCVMESMLHARHEALRLMMHKKPPYTAVTSSCGKLQGQVWKAGRNDTSY